MNSKITSLLGTLASIGTNEVHQPKAALAGPAYPAPSTISGSTHLAEAITNFNSLISASPEIQANGTAWTVALFSTNEQEPLYERYFTLDYDVGVAKTNRSSIFRIASVSKVFSVWTFLMEVGAEHFNEPITKYVPELAKVSNVSIPYEVTLGQLASHLAGIPRDLTLLTYLMSS